MRTAAVAIKGGVRPRTRTGPRHVGLEWPNRRCVETFRSSSTTPPLAGGAPGYPPQGVIESSIDIVTARDRPREMGPEAGCGSSRMVRGLTSPGQDRIGRADQVDPAVAPWGGARMPVISDAGNGRRPSARRLARMLPKRSRASSSRSIAGRMGRKANCPFR